MIVIKSCEFKTSCFTADGFSCHLCSEYAHHLEKNPTRRYLSVLATLSQCVADCDCGSISVHVRPSVSHVLTL